VPGSHALSVARRYHDGWSTGNYQQSIELLEPGLTIEVPINEYPTAASFADALRSFGSLVTAVELLSALGDADEAMLLYDMEVERLGSMRVAEHFTITDGRIVRLRQIHDTAALRAAGMGS
jgi:ketosteroid isomerase-like protein